ncbi:MAG TPA: hypothetical protein VM140_11930 [Burkholderiales bacterium]|nr:hypothetical protein [Burkholderiales bacterium]
MVAPKGLLVALAIALPCAAADGDPVAQPQVSKGDTWSYRRIDEWEKKQLDALRFTVSFVDAKAIHVTLKRANVEEETDAIYTADWNATVDSIGGIMTPHMGLLRFPLRVGQSYKTTWVSHRPQTGLRARHEHTVSVLGWEEMTVPGGKFRVLKIQSKGTYQRQDVVGGGSASYTFWYAPEVKRWVRLRYEDTDFYGRPYSRFYEELTEFKLQ